MNRKDVSLILLIAEALEVIADCLRLLDFEIRAEEKLKGLDEKEADRKDA